MAFKKGDPNINRAGRIDGGVMARLRNALGDINVEQHLKADFLVSEKVRQFCYEHFYGKPPQINVNENENVNFSPKEFFDFHLVEKTDDRQQGTVPVSTEQKADGDI